VYIIFPPYSPSYTISPHSPRSYWYQPPSQDLFGPPGLQFCNRKKIRH
jgi:hypothetical protein